MKLTKLKDWLAEQGFQHYLNHLGSRDNRANWYSCRKTNIECRECETNDGKRMQIVVNPHSYIIHGDIHESVEINVTGEAGGVWYQLNAYSLSVDEVHTRLDEIERNLIAAWNALAGAK